MCVLTRSSLNCPTIADVQQQGLVPSASWTARTPLRILGIAADEVVSVKIVMVDGSVRTVPITDNLLDYTPDAPARAVEWTGPDGSHRFSLPILTGR